MEYCLVIGFFCWILAAVELIFFSRGLLGEPFGFKDVIANRKMLLIAYGLVSVVFAYLFYFTQSHVKGDSARVYFSMVGSFFLLAFIYSGGSGYIKVFNFLNLDPVVFNKFTGNLFSASVSCYTVSILMSIFGFGYSGSE